VLGGGGVTGIAWEVGVLVGLAGAGIDLTLADAVIGTSAGAFVGAALASGYDLERLFAAQLEPPGNEISATASDELYGEWAEAFAAGGDDRRAVGAALGRIARARPEPVPTSARRRVVERRLVTTEWPATLLVTAIDADSGELTVFDRDAGVALLDAVSASGAVTGIWPLVRIGDRAFTDGGMVSSANAFLAEGYDRVVVVAPIPDGRGQIPGAIEDVAALGGRARSTLITPDEGSISAIGPNALDPERRSPAAIAGREQGDRFAAEVSAVW
jgi:NTE family protein